jgi:multisubunit Na+/H+ antiporter MnhF subunit
VNVWLIGALALLPGLAACGAACLLWGILDAVIALELAGVLATVELMLLAEGTHRQPFIDLAIALALMSFVGALAFVRLLERHL